MAQVHLTYILAILLAFVASALSTKNATVHIKNEMGPDIDLEVHCYSSIAKVDLGAHNLNNNGVYSFSFSPDAYAKLGNVSYECVFVAVGFRVSHVTVYSGSYYPHTQCSCTKRGHCPRWIVKPAGFFCRGKKAATWAL